MKFCCVTTCYNAAALIEHTMLSVLNQTAFGEGQDNSLHYVIQDAESTDKTYPIVLALVERYKDHPQITLESVSMSDSGMYHGLARGFERLSDGDVYCYINAGDYFVPQAFSTVKAVFNDTQVGFITGMNSVVNERNQIVDVVMPYSYERDLLEAGFYGRVLPFVQQETTFWGKHVHSQIDLITLAKFKLAGDYALWRMLILASPMYVVSALLGCFKVHEGQLNVAFREQYAAEMNNIAKPASFTLRLKAFCHYLYWRMPSGSKKRIAPHTIVYNHVSGRYQLSKSR